MLSKISSVLVLLLFLILPKNVLAEGEFATAYDVLYDVGEEGLTTVTKKISLRNLTSEHYANQYKLTIGATEVFDIKAQDPSGPLEVLSEQKDASTVLTVKFNAQVAGFGKNLPWTLVFKTRDFAEKSGKVWEIRAPKVSAGANLENYNLTISVPQSFGILSGVSPSPKSQSQNFGKIFLTFDAAQLKSSGVSATFGTSQLFDFDLAYHLENNNLMPILTSIALPPDTAYQDIIFQRLEPNPLNVTLDEDGNYLAWYKLKRGEKINIRAIGSAKLYSSSKVKNPHLPQALKKKYTASDKYWEKDNPQITGILNEILGENPPQETKEKARLIFEYVVGNLKYDPGRLEGELERFGAVTALNNPERAICMEFTDLFIALSRAAGIPARELDGYAHTSNTKLRPLSLSKDMLHAWPEYWDDAKGWVMVDPTWQNTTGGVDYFNKLDLNHFVFAIKGSSSKEPIPAGSYGFKEDDANDVKVTLSENDFLGKSQLDVEFLSGGPFFSGFPGSVKVKVTNLGNGLFPSSSLVMMADKLKVLSPDGRVSGPIPSYGSAEFEFKVRTKSLFDSYNETVTLLIGGQKFAKEIKVQPFVLFQPIPMVIGIILGLMGAVYLAILITHLKIGKFLKIKK